MFIFLIFSKHPPLLGGGIIKCFIIVLNKSENILKLVLDAIVWPVLINLVL